MGALLSKKQSRTALDVQLMIMSLRDDEEVCRLILREGMLETTQRILDVLEAENRTGDALFGSSYTGIPARIRQHFIRICCVRRGIELRVALRKRFMYDEVMGALKQGARQVVVIGAGFDILAYMLSKRFRDVTFVEVDHPATLPAKQKAVDSMGKPENLHFVAVDLMKHRLDAKLGELSVWDSNAQTIAVVEGLLMYLPQSDVKNVFHCLKACSGPRSSAAISYISKTGVHRSMFLGLLALWIYGEPMLCTLSKSELKGLLESTGCKVDISDERCNLGLRYNIKELTSCPSRSEDFFTDFVAFVQLD